MEEYFTRTLSSGTGGPPRADAVVSRYLHRCQSQHQPCMLSYQVNLVSRLRRHRAGGCGEESITRVVATRGASFIPLSTDGRSVSCRRVAMWSRQGTLAALLLGRYQFDPYGGSRHGVEVRFLVVIPSTVAVLCSSMAAVAGGILQVALGRENTFNTLGYLLEYPCTYPPGLGHLGAYPRVS